MTILSRIVIINNNNNMSLFEYLPHSRHVFFKNKFQSLWQLGKVSIIKSIL